ncbi:MAG: hypothetical protein AAFP19_19070, partial [Bacteroidota bacterium]
MKYSKLYQKLKKQFSDEEIVDSTFIPADLTSKEKDKLDKEMKEIRLQSLRETTEEDRILADVMRLRFQIENYIKKEGFSFEKTFGKFLNEYIRVLKRSRNEFSEDLNLHYTKLSRIINDKEEPNIELCYRLDKHSGNLIKAELWWHLIIKKPGFIVSHDTKTRKAEY